MRKLRLLPLILLGLCSCKKKNKTPDEYFSFTANGVHYDYPQDVKYGFGTSRRAIYAVASSATVGYFIVGSSFKNPTAEGAVTLNFANNYLPDQDTVLIDGINAIASVSDLNVINNSFYANGGNEGTGIIIFTIRTSNRLTGTFEFTAKSQNDGSFINITNGKFSIIPAQ